MASQVVVRHDRGVSYPELFATHNVSRIVVEYYDTELKKERKLYFSGGRMTVDVTIGSWKYGPEFQIKYHTRESPEIKERTNQHNGHQRVGFYLSSEEGKRLVKALST